MPKTSAGILLYRHRHGAIEVLLVHPGGPFWRRRDAGAWSIPKGECRENEPVLDTALREFGEELGSRPEGEAQALGDVVQAAGKRVTAFAVLGEFEPDGLRSNMFEMEWPPRSGKLARFPEVDRAEWFTLPEAREKINAAQAAFLGRLEVLSKQGR
jgi:predicted NUDIX family NTP pyrophosphohydrolase